MKSNGMNNLKKQHRRTRLGENESIKPDISGKVIDNKYGYEIKLKNHLDEQWASWFDGWTITNIDDEEVILTCSETDHAGLHGVLDKIRDLNLTIISVNRLMPGSKAP